MTHAVLLGDSIFDNAAYTQGGLSVIQHLAHLLPSPWKATLLAIDGSVTDDVESQLAALPDDASHIVISCGGNDALGQFGVLTERVGTVSAALDRLARVRAVFQADYRRMIERAVQRRQWVAVCTIYDAIPTLDRAALCAIALFNDIIIREAKALGVPVLDLRAICTSASDYSRVSPIEPSASGGRKIADALAGMMEGKPDRDPRCWI
jgi:lysophospholipase L1-like esterase